MNRSQPPLRVQRMHAVCGRRGALALPATLVALVLASVSAAAAELVQLDPFAAATQGMPACAAPQPPLLTPEAARTEAHVRAERGTRCGMDGSCEAGGAYRRDPEINERVRGAIANEARFARTSVWLTTTRGWVTLQGCVRSAGQRRALVAFVARQPGVTRVFDELHVKR